MRASSESISPSTMSVWYLGVHEGARDDRKQRGGHERDGVAEPE